MGSELTFRLQEHIFSAELTKLDRKKIYGWSDVKTYDNQNRECLLATLSDDGTIIIPPGGIALGQFTATGEYRSRSELFAADLYHQFLEILPSSFDSEIELQTATIDDLLSLNIKSVYQLTVSNLNQVSQFLKDKIFRFSFNYRKSFDPDDAFLVENDGAIFLIVGKPAIYEFIGLKELPSEPELEAVSEETDDLDFSMF
ncbi:MAG: hypothetical protein NZ108_09030 [Bacteroidia bacterium]|nr:hypothetical protein [Bacteroidia bacterium]